MDKDITLNLIVLRSVNPELAVAFYRSLGVDFAKEKHGNGPEHFAGQVGSAVLEIYPQEASSPTSGLRLGFLVDNLENRLGAVCAAGGKVFKAPQESPWGRRAVVADPDGHQVELVQSK